MLNDDEVTSALFGQGGSSRGGQMKTQRGFCKEGAAGQQCLGYSQDTELLKCVFTKHCCNERRLLHHRVRYVRKVKWSPLDGRTEC